MFYQHCSTPSSTTEKHIGEETPIFGKIDNNNKLLINNVLLIAYSLVQMFYIYITLNHIIVFISVFEIKFVSRIKLIYIFTNLWTCLKYGYLILLSLFDIINLKTENM